MTSRMKVMPCVGFDFAHSGRRTLRTYDPGLAPWAVSFGPFGAERVSPVPRGIAPPICPETGSSPVEFAPTQVPQLQIRIIDRVHPNELPLFPGGI